MFSQAFITITMAIATVAAISPDSYRYGSRRPLQSIQSDNTDTFVSTVFGTATLTLSTTIPNTVTPSATEAAPEPTYTATQLFAYREDSPIHLLPLQARGLYFQLGGSPTTACPSFVEDCPPGILTGINQCQLSVLVPGGQQIYLNPDGSLRFTAAHSMAMAPGSIQCPLTFKENADDVSEASIHGFGAKGFMACPMIGNEQIPEQWEVYADIPNATVPLRNGTTFSCLSFEAIGVKYNLGETPAAFEYL